MAAHDRISLKRLETDLRKLHRRGMANPRLDDLEALCTAASTLSRQPTDIGRVTDALARAIDAAWRPPSHEGNTVRLWFGLPVLNDPSAQDTRTLTSTERHKIAWKYFRQGKLSTFRTSAADRRYGLLSKTLWRLADELPSSPTAITSAAHEHNVRPLVPVAYADAISNLTCLFSDAIRLHEVCLVYLRVQALDNAFHEISKGERLRRHRPALLRPMWEAYRDLLFSSTYCFDTDIESSIREKIAKYLPATVLTNAEQAISQINASIGNDDLVGRVIYLLHTQGAEGHDIRSYRQQLQDTYVGFWSSLSIERDFDERVTGIVKACNSLLGQLRDYVEPVDHAATAKKALAAAISYYGIARQTKLAESMTLNDLLELAGLYVEHGATFSFNDDDSEFESKLDPANLDIPS